MEKSDQIFVTGHMGLVGSSIVRRLRRGGYSNLLLRTRAELDLTRQSEVDALFERERPDYVYLAAGRVGGIEANRSYPAEFIYENLAILTNVIHSAYIHKVKKLLFLGSSCIYPKLSPQPIKEEYLLTGPLEPTNEWYAIAKIAGLKMAQAYRRQYGFRAICVMPTNLYGPGDNFDLTSSHVLPALIRKFHDAKISSVDAVRLWGSGQPRREFLHVDDLADACVFLMETFDDDQIVNIGTGEDLTISELSEMVKDVVGYEGRIEFDASMPDGTPRKQLDVSKIAALGWRHSTSLRRGIEETYRWYVRTTSMYGGTAT